MNSNDHDVSQFMQQGDEVGEGGNFDEACADAWRKLGKPSDWCKVKHQWVKVENPVSEHKVIMGTGA